MTATHKKKEVEQFESILKCIYQSNNYRKDLCWPHFHNGPRVQEKQQVRGPTNLQFQVATRGTSPDVTTVFHTWAYGGFIKIQSNRERYFIEWIKAPIFLEAVLAIEIMSEPQSNLEEKVDPSILKNNISSRAYPSIFTSIETVLLVKQNQLSFPSTEINKPLLAPVHSAL